MNNWVSYKTKQFFFVLIKLSIVTGAIYFILKKLTNNPEIDFSVFVSFLAKNDVFSTKNLLLLLILTSFNWFLEIIKWQKLVASFNKIDFKYALEQSLGALTASLFTPNRIGEYGAKAIYFSRNFRKKIVLLNLIGNITQMLATTFFGVIGLLFFITKYNVNIDYYNLARVLLIALLTFTIIGFGVKNSKFTIKGISIKKIKSFFVNLSKKTLSYTLLLSFSRYLVFSFQFYFLLQIFNIKIDYLNAMILISSMYFLSSIIPSIIIFDVVIKGSVALFVFSFIGVNELTILSISTLMWLLNFVLPSLFGSYYVLNFNLPKDST
ncbi:lysylphosphatidylglycerol synthase domain-containing protein [Seonamhaeicola maritimus]|uniref:lysylphosphatidylglycerol synthase domain-containing protein n=1 Tax=Seonamhaeicola maritimus TaxID=2591822 RepID=UPI002495083F|nr:lysylphosphatidylglycerol synthase domain-containing protein [Seonamhaeicola maritimus]